MDKRLLIGFFVFLAAFLILPIAVQKMKQGKLPEGVAESGGNITQASAKKPFSDVPELNQPPLLNELNLVGSEWQVQVENYKIKITLAAGGVCYATHPLAKAITGVDYLEGRWRVEGDQFHVSTAFGGKEYGTTLKISGSNLYYVESKKYSKVERFK
jgi:hypothetical protein